MAIRQKCRAILAIIHSEIRRLRSNKVLLFLIVVYPIFSLFFFFNLFSTGVITNMPIAVVDEDNSSSSQLLIQKLSATPAVNITERFTDFPTAKKSLLDGEVFAVVLIPYRFESDALGGNQPSIVTYINGQYFSAAQTINQGITKTLVSLNGTQVVNNLVSQTGTSPLIAKEQLVAIPVDAHPLFNPTRNYYFSLGSGVFPMVLELLMMIMAGMSVLNDLLDPKTKVRNLKLANGSFFSLLVIKLFPYFLLYLLYTLIFDFILIEYMNMPVNGHLGILLLGDILFIIASLLFGSLVAMIVMSRTKAISSISVFASPAFGFSGMIFPRMAMNDFSYYWGSVLPLTWYCEIRLDQTIRNIGTGYSIGALTALGILIAVFSFLIYIVAKLKKLGN